MVETASLIPTRLLFNSTTSEGRELSNFAYFPFKIRLKCGVFEFRYAENAYHLLKHATITEDLAKEWIRLDPLTAKKKSAKIKVRQDWRETKDSAMLYVLEAKFTNRDARAYLQSTGDRELIYFSPWDDYWGTGVMEGDNFKGENRLGEILMNIRAGIV